MKRIRGRITRQEFPAGMDGEALVIDSRTPTGLGWKPGVDRLITDLSPELSGDLDANDFSITGLDTLTFTDTAGTVAGIQNQNLVDKSAAETIAGLWSHNANIDMNTNKVVDLGAPSAGTDAATKTYADGVVGYITGSGNASLAMSATTYYPCPVSGTATHTRGSESSSVFTMPGNQSVFKYTGTPTIVAEILCTGYVIRSLPNSGTTALFVVFGKANNAVPAHGDQMAAPLLLSSIEYNTYTPFSINSVVTLVTNDYIAPMFLNFLATATYNLAGTHTRIRSIREV